MATTAATGADQTIEKKGYAHPEALVTTEWLAAHSNDPTLRILESDEDVLLYDTGHIPGALKIDWHADLNDPVQRDYISREQFQALAPPPRDRRVRRPSIFYGDKNNWWATYAFWVFRLFGFTNAQACSTAAGRSGSGRARR